EEAHERRRFAHSQKRRGAVLEGVDAALTRFTVIDLFTDRSVRRPFVCSFLMMLSVTFAYWGVGTFIPTFVGNIATKAGLSAPYYSVLAGFITSGCGVVGFISLGFLTDAIGRKPTAMLFYLMCLILSPLVYLWGQSQEISILLWLVGLFGFFSLGIWAWAPVWLPELYPTRMRATAVAFVFNAPRFISCVGPLIAGTLIVALGGYGWAATYVGLLFCLRAGAAVLAGDKGQAAATCLVARQCRTQTGRYRASRRLSGAKPQLCLLPALAD